jgi:predicted enzyme related to lactoylglutathione lyase
VLARDDAKLDVTEMVTFIPARDFAASVRFYGELFDVNWQTDSLCQIQAGHSKFLIQDFYQSEFANNSTWGRVIYLWGPSGELWHLTQRA